MYKIAFHLRNGANFRQWQIKDASNHATYINPETHDIVMYDCNLRNQKGTSLRIFNGAEKQRGAWVECAMYEIVSKDNYTSDVEVRFNPRVCPTWVVGGLSEQDGRRIFVIKTNGRKLYI
jgi:hypothetical protein